MINLTQYHPNMISLARRLTKNSTLAEDLVQTVWCKVYGSPVIWDKVPEHKTLSYLYAAVKNRWLDMVKAEKVRHRPENPRIFDTVTLPNQYWAVALKEVENLPPPPASDKHRCATRRWQQKHKAAFI